VSAAAPPAGGGRSLSRLEKLLFRLESQLAVLAHVARAIEGRPGVVFELGLGKGRTYDHLRERLPGREIFVFEREVDTNPYRMPDEAMAGLVSRLLPPALAPGALVVADLPLTLPDCAPLPLPEGAVDGRYFLYRHGD